MKVKLKDGLGIVDFCKATFVTKQIDESFNVEMLRQPLEATMINSNGMVVLAPRIDGCVKEFFYRLSASSIWEVIEH